MQETNVQSLIPHDQVWETPAKNMFIVVLYFRYLFPLERRRVKCSGCDACKYAHLGLHALVVTLTYLAAVLDWITYLVVALACLLPSWWITHFNHNAHAYFVVTPEISTRTAARNTDMWVMSKI